MPAGKTFRQLCGEREITAEQILGQILNEVKRPDKPDFRIK